jgi:hypothetical protein
VTPFWGVLILTTLVALAISFALGLVGVRKRFTGLLIGIGSVAVVADIVGAAFCRGGASYACLLYYAIPLICVIAGHVGVGVRHSLMLARGPGVKCENCGTAVFEGTATICPMCHHLVKCERCGYDLTGNTSGVCPECGERI